MWNPLTTIWHVFVAEPVLYACDSEASDIRTNHVDQLHIATEVWATRMRSPGHKITLTYPSFAFHTRSARVALHTSSNTTFWISIVSWSHVPPHSISRHGNTSFVNHGTSCNKRGQPWRFGFERSALKTILDIAMKSQERAFWNVSERFRVHMTDNSLCKCVSSRMLRLRLARCVIIVVTRTASD